MTTQALKTYHAFPQMLKSIKMHNKAWHNVHGEKGPLMEKNQKQKID